MQRGDACVPPRQQADQLRRCAWIFVLGLENIPAAAPVRRRAGQVVESAAAIFRRLLTLEVIDRSLVIGAQAFSALIPLLIVFASVGFRNGRTFADDLVSTFQLSGRGADAVRSVLTAPGDGPGLTVAGLLLVVFSSLSFTRALQRTYELAWGLRRRGVKGSAWGLLWLAVFALYWWLAPLVGAQLTDRTRLLASVSGSFLLWLVTPYVLLARRVAWQRLVPQAALTAIGMTALELGAVLYIPHAMNTAAAEFGGIGCAFTLLSLLWAGGFVLVAAAVLGSYAFLPAERA
jgi:membrane protein